MFVFLMWACAGLDAAPPTLISPVDPPSSSIVPGEAVVTDTAVLLQFDLLPTHGAPSSHRVFPDGRYEERTPLKLTLGADGRVVEQGQPAVWRPVTTLSAEAIVALRAAIDRAANSTPNPRYSVEGVRDGTTIVWTLQGSAGRREVVVEGYPTNTVPGLEELYRTFNQLRTPPKSSSIWRVELGSAVERTVGCDISSVPAFRPVIQAMFDPGALSAAPAGAVVPSGGALVDVRYLSAGVESARLRVYSSGLVTRTRDGAEVAHQQLSSAGLTRLQSALAALDLASLKEPICG